MTRSKHIQQHVDTTARGAAIQAVAKILVAAPSGGPVSREDLTDGESDFLSRAIANLVKGGVLTRKWVGKGQGAGVTTTYTVANWDALQVILDQQSPEQVYLRWVSNPPTRKLPVRPTAGGARVAVTAAEDTDQRVAELMLPPIGEINRAAKRAEPSSGFDAAGLERALRIHGAVEVLLREGVLQKGG